MPRWATRWSRCWTRPLEDVYAVVYFDGIRAMVRDEGLVKNKAVYLGIGVTCAGRKEVAAAAFAVIATLL